jgi:hypothetical protein
LGFWRGDRRLEFSHRIVVGDEKRRLGRYSSLSVSINTRSDPS